MSGPNWFLETGLSYAEHFGWCVHPLEVRGKRPLLPDWPNVASTDPEHIRAWWKRWPLANVGIVTGSRSGIVVLDVDPRNGGIESLAKLEAERGALPRTLRVNTGRGDGGNHRYFRHPGGTVASRKLGPGLDLQADGGRQVVAPPSIHPDTGLPYEWDDGCDDIDAPEALI